MTTQKIFFKSLDTLRFFAFFLVFCQHAFRPAFDLRSDDFISKLITFLCNGALGVSFFFVLSGFLITYLILREIIQTGKIKVHFFYIRRALRIWPLYYAVIIFTLILYPSLKEVLGLVSFEYVYATWMHFIFLSNFDIIRAINLFPGQNVAMISITWSVAIEEQFYLVWPLLFRFIPVKYYRFIFPAVILASLFFRLVHEHERTVLYFHTLSVINDLAIGGYAAYLCLYNQHFLPKLKAIKRAPIVLAYLLGFTLLIYEGTLQKITTFSVFVRIFESLFFIFIILEQNFSDHSIKKYGDWKLLASLGRITYGLYLLHPICIQFVELGWRYAFPAVDQFSSQLIRGLLALGFSILVCTFSYRYFEDYFLRLKEKF